MNLVEYLSEIDAANREFREGIGECADRLNSRLMAAQEAFAGQLAEAAVEIRRAQPKVGPGLPASARG